VCFLVLLVLGGDLLEELHEAFLGWLEGKPPCVRHAQGVTLESLLPPPELFHGRSAPKHGFQHHGRGAVGTLQGFNGVLQRLLRLVLREVSSGSVGKQQWVGGMQREARCVGLNRRWVVLGTEFLVAVVAQARGLVRVWGARCRGGEDSWRIII